MYASEEQKYCPRRGSIQASTTACRARSCSIFAGQPDTTISCCGLDFDHSLEAYLSTININTHIREAQ